MKKTNSISAPGKLIISGEHAVVYGHPAIATAVNFRLKIGSGGNIESDIPIGAGMGSSAAYAVAKTALKFKKLDLEKINSAAYMLERLQHGNPSGVDNTVVTYGGFLWYRKESENFKTFRQIESKAKLPKIYLLNSGKPRETTKEMVSYVGSLYRRRKKWTKNIFGEIETVTKGFLELLLEKKVSDFGRLMMENEGLLEKLGVVSESAKILIHRIEKMGGFAKISGAGGKKEGSGMILIYHKDIEKITFFTKNNNLNIIPVKMGEEGVRMEHKKGT
jgi:mevalonate kinase